MYSLFLDCTTKRLVVAILLNNKNIDSYYFETNKNLVDVINDIINQILNKNQLQYQDIKAIYCINGPGNFTGIRVAKLVANLWKAIFNVDLYQLDKLQFISQDSKPSLIEADKLNYYIIENETIKIIEKNKIDLCNYNLNANTYNFENQWQLNAMKFKKTLEIQSLYIKSAL